MRFPRDRGTHNANNVGPGKPFLPGFYYELVVETDSRAILPSVHVWQDHGNTVIPGTLVPTRLLRRAVGTPALHWEAPPT